MLNPINNDIKLKPLWCGQAALAAIIGQPVSRVVELVKEYRSKPGYDYPFPSLEWQLMRDIAEKFDITFEEINLKSSGISVVKDCHQWALLVIGATGNGHYVVINDGLLVDSFHHSPTKIFGTDVDSLAPVRYGFFLRKNFV